jgi:glycosyltransferase involved in cell wall biosynthesis
VKVLIVSGIWPPDVGGPASHAPEVAEFLRASGHQVDVVVTADTKPASRPYPVRHTPRILPIGIRHAHALALVAWRCLSSDVLYTTGMFGRSGIAAWLTRTPYVVKLTGDPAFERLRARGAIEGDVDVFQRGGGSLGRRLLVALRNAVLRRASHVFTPSSYLRSLVLSWGVPEERVSVLPNPAPTALPSASRQELRDALGFSGPTLAFAGRLTAQKDLGVLLDAVAACPHVALVIAGDGPERERLERRLGELRLADRVRLVGPLERAAVLELFAAADACVLSSSWENFPHTVVEALAVGTPVVSTAAGGVPEVVEDGVNGLLVPVGDAPALAGAIRRLVADQALAHTLAAAAAQSVEAYAPERLLTGLERALVEAAG